MTRDCLSGGAASAYKGAMVHISSMILGGFVIAVTILHFIPAKAWWVRIWDFPRFQLAIAGALAFVGAIATNEGARSPAFWLFVGVLGGAVLYQAGRVWRYSRLAPFEVER